MGKFRKEGKKEVPQVSTSSLPDIVYMLIFFFMITTTMRELSPMVDYTPPMADQVQKLERKDLVCNIYIGHPKDDRGDEAIQLDDSYALPEDIVDWIQKERDSRNPSEIPLMTTALKVDKHTRMGIVTDVKQELRKVGAFRINYTTYKGDVNKNLN